MQGSFAFLCFSLLLVFCNNAIKWYAKFKPAPVCLEHYKPLSILYWTMAVYEQYLWDLIFAI